MQKTYTELIENISCCLNSSYRTKEDRELFKQCLRELKDEYKKEISTKFLKEFMPKNLSNHEKTYLIRNFLRSMGLKTERRTRDFSNWANQVLSTDKTEYDINKKGEVFIKECVPQDIGKFVKEFGQEILYFIRGF